MNTGLLLGIVLIGALFLYKKDPSIFQNLFKTGGATAPSSSTAAAPGAVAPPSPSPATGTTPANAAGLTTAQQLITTGVLTVPPSFGGAVILMPNEGHELTGNAQCLDKVNCETVPKKLVCASGSSICWLNDDFGHVHSLVVKGGQKTTAMKDDASTTPIRFDTPGTFTYTSTFQPKQTGTIEITAEKATGTATAGAILCPVGDTAAYLEIIKAAGIVVTSSVASGKVTVIVYNSPSDPASTAGKMGAVTKKTPWT